MGCIKSKTDYTVQNTSHLKKNRGKESKKGDESIALVGNIPERKDFKPANPVLLEYAHRLSEEIVSKAVKQWAEVDSKYSDIPYIESDIP
ncbi:small membrane A-kinase anchor protein [Anomaloglossus baeobatrachus]|uniref:small membrane A-kinase anchor protein n=1 Tax=Anomaloglossus baeobatrachus TaxID=238106 RepID=UPI003F50567A